MSLQKLCLDSIAKGIEMYNLAYTSGDNEVLRRGFVILHKMYPDELLQRLITQRNLKEEYASLVFNKNLKAIDTEWFSSFSWETIVDIFTRIGPSLENIIIRKHKYDGGEGELWKRIICHVPNVKVLIFKQHCHNDILHDITLYCSMIETLDIRGSRRVNDGLKYLYQMKKGTKRDNEGECLVQEAKVPCPLLKEIFLGGTAVNAEDIEELLKNIPLLENLHHHNVPFVIHKINTNNLGPLFKVERLKHLFITPVTDLDDILKSCIILCPYLKSFSSPVYTLEHLRLCAKLHDVEDLQLNFYNFENNSHNEVISFLEEHGKKITSLTFSDCIVPFSALGEFCPRLKHLTLSEVVCEYDEDEDESVPILCNLREFTVDCVDLEEDENCERIYQILQCSPILEKLEFQHCSSFSLEMQINILKSCKQSSMKYISFIHCDVRSKFLINILYICLTLETLSVEGDEVKLSLRKKLCNIAETLPNKPKVYVRFSK